MKFVSRRMEHEFNFELHPDARTVAIELDAWCQRQDYPEITLTEVVRTDDEQERIYLEIGLAVLGKLGMGAELSHSEHGIAEKIKNLDEGEVRAWARHRFTWHKVAAAIDIRTKDHAPAQLHEIDVWLRRRCPPGPWELVTEAHGTGVHFHVGRRDFQWRSTFKPKPINVA